MRSLLLFFQTSNEESSSGNIHAFTSPSSSQVVNPNPSAPPVVSSSATNGLHPSGAPGLIPNGTNATLSAASSRTAPLLTTTSGMIFTTITPRWTLKLKYFEISYSILFFFFFFFTMNYDFNPAVLDT